MDALPELTAKQAKLAYLRNDLQQRQLVQRYRHRQQSDNHQSIHRQIKGQTFLAFNSNDYLGLASHPDVVKAFKQAADHWGVGAGSAHLVNGHTRVHHELEEQLAELTGRDRALLFSSGYMANIGVINALLDRHDILYQDKLNHASLIDAGQLSRARMKRFRHRDNTQLKQFMQQYPDRFSLISTDSVFSMDGDIASLQDLSNIANNNNAWLMADDAHGFGVLGKHGAGCCDHFSLDQQALPVLMGTLGKAVGVFGAFVAGSELLIETLIQRARSYVYTTAPPPAMAAASLTALHLVKVDDWRREKLKHTITHFRQNAKQLGLPLMDSPSAIQPLLAGSDAVALDWSQRLKDRGILVTAIRPPTVEEGKARLRITFSAQHDIQHVDQLLEALSELPCAEC